MDTITIPLTQIIKLGLDINEYLTLLKLHLLTEKNEKIPFKSDTNIINSLVKKKFLIREDNSLSLIKNSHSLFQPTDDLFEQFYITYPNKVPNDIGGYRPVSTLDHEGMSANRTRTIWKRILGRNLALQRKAIQCLEIEIAERTRNGTIKYLQNVDTWLRQATWEKWEYLIGSKLLRDGTNIKKL